MKIVLNISGNPRRIIVDKGTSFTSSAFKDFCKEENIDLIFTTTGVPRGNGQVERLNRIVISSLSIISIENPENWYLYVGKVRKFINSSYQRAIRTTPFELMFGVRMRKSSSDIQQIIAEEILFDFNDQRDELRIQAKQQIEKIQNENRKNFNEKRKEAKVYQIDDLAAITKTQFSTGAKLKPELFGPYKVTKSTGNERYEVKKVGNHDGPNITTSCAENMKSWPNVNVLKLVDSPEETIKMFDKFQNFNIIIEGNIEAGKSTLLEHLEELSPAKVIKLREPLEKWTNANKTNKTQIKRSLLFYGSSSRSKQIKLFI